MKLSIALQVTRNEYKMVTSAVRDLAGMATTLSNNDPKVTAFVGKLDPKLNMLPTATVSIKSKLAALAYSLKLASTIDIEFEIDIDPECLAIQIALVIEVLSFLTPMVGAGLTMSKNLDSIKRIKSQLADFERGLKPQFINMELSETTI